MIQGSAANTERSMAALTGVTAITRANTLPELETALLEAMTHLGVDTYSTALLVNPSRMEPEKTIVTNWPDEWRRIWSERKLYFVDAVGLQAVANPGGFRWKDISAHTRAIGKDVFEAAKEYGMIDGFTLSVHHASKPVALLNVSGKKLEWSELDDGVARLIADAYLSRLFQLRDLHLRDGFKKLSPRERQCLYMVAAGLTDKEIAREMTLSHNTITQYLRVVCGKMQASNRAAAVATAIWLGEIAP